MMERVRGQPVNLPYLPGLDALRALAVGVVFAYHAAGSSVPGGFLGVDVFFVLSGYLITGLLLGGSKVRVGASVSRQASAIVSRLAQYRATGSLPPRVVIQMGNNGTIGDADLARLRRVLRGVQKVVLITLRVPRSWESQANGAISKYARANDNVVLADWRSASRAPGLLWDGIHPNPKGQNIYANVVAKALAKAPPE